MTHPPKRREITYNALDSGNKQDNKDNKKIQTVYIS